ncbi:TonB family protein [Phenylobacterium sp.]|uniref:TonB family protein n=1 Tax=Phenylobacterium sp. TaxID=1871053 RepID=UPI003D267094
MVKRDGSLEKCVLIKEAPVGAGFGNILLSLSSRYRMRRYDLDQKLVAGRSVDVAMRVGAPDLPISMPPPGGLRFGAVKWRETPGYLALSDAYPKRAWKQKMAGFAVLDCRAGPDGRLVACSATAKPANEGFDAAALGLAPKFRMGPKAIDGSEIVEGTPIQIPIRFLMNAVRLDVIHAAHPNLPDGQVALDCRVTDEGRLDNCVVTSETPNGKGLGDIALRLSARMRFAEPADEFSRVIVPVDFAKGSTPPR